MTNKEKIEKFMSEMDCNWDNLKKLRYICVKLCEIYQYDPKYAYVSEDAKSEYMNNLHKGLLSHDTTEQEKAIDYENNSKICVNIFAIYLKLIKQAGIPEDKYMILGNSIYYTDDDETIYDIHPVEEMFCVKTKSKPQGFKVYGTNGDAPNERIMQIDKEIGFIDEKGYIGELTNITQEQSVEEKDAEELAIRVERVLKQGAEYLKKVIGVQIDNVELHKFYKHLLKTAFPRNQCIVKPLASAELENIEYVILAKLSENAGECTAFLYDKNDGNFHRKSIVDIRTTMAEKGLIDVGKNNEGCIDKLCDACR